MLIFFQIKLAKLLLACLSGFMLIISSPGFPWPWLAWVALIPLMLALKSSRLSFSFILGFFAGLIFFLGSFHWVNHASGVTWYDYLSLGLFLAGYFGIFGAGFHLLVTKLGLSMILVIPSLWVVIEYVRAEAGFLALPMAKLGHSQYLNTFLIQIAEVTGDYGVSFLVVLINVIILTIVLTLLVNKRITDYSLLSFLIVLMPVVYGFSISLSQPVADQMLSVAVVQGNILPEESQKPELEIMHLEKYAFLSRQAAESAKPQVIVWPEGAVSDYLLKNSILLQRIIALARSVDAFMIIGSSERLKYGANEIGERKPSLNAAYLISPTGKFINSYHKIRLVPFSEYLPMADHFPWTERLRASASNYIPGEKYTLFDIENQKVGVIICWEVLFTNVVRQFVKQGADVLVNIGNEAWFGETNAPYQILAAAVFRAVENRVAIARSINTGVSGFINPHGKILSTVNQNGRELFIEGFKVDSLPVLNHSTFYTLYGDVFIFANMIILLFLTLYGISQMTFKINCRT